MELPEASCLRPLVAEHRTDVEIFLWERIGRPIVFDEGADRAGRGFRAQGQRGPIPVGKGVHLFLDDVRRRANTPGKECGEFEDGDTDLLIPVRVRPTPRRFLNETPPRCFLRQDILDTFDPLNDHGRITEAFKKIRDYSGGVAGKSTQAEGSSSSTVKRRSRDRKLGDSAASQTTYNEGHCAFLRRLARGRIVRDLSVVRGCFMGTDQPTRRVI